MLAWTVRVVCFYEVFDLHQLCADESLQTVVELLLQAFVRLVQLVQVFDPHELLSITSHHDAGDVVSKLLGLVLKVGRSHLDPLEVCVISGTLCSIRQLRDWCNIALDLENLQLIDWNLQVLSLELVDVPLYLKQK